MDAPRSTTLQFSPPLINSISSWPERQSDITRKVKKLQKSLPPFGWDTEPVMGAEVIIEESFIDVFLPPSAPTIYRPKQGHSSALTWSATALGGAVGTVITILATLAEFLYIPTNWNDTSHLSRRLLFILVTLALTAGPTFYIAVAANQPGDSGSLALILGIAIFSSPSVRPCCLESCPPVGCLATGSRASHASTSRLKRSLPVELGRFVATPSVSTASSAAPAHTGLLSTSWSSASPPSSHIVPPTSPSYISNIASPLSRMGLSRSPPVAPTLPTRSASVVPTSLLCSGSTVPTRISIVVSRGEDGNVVIWQVDHNAFEGWNSDDWTPVDFLPILHINTSPWKVGEVLWPLAA
jgi:hypothetical protein